MNVYKEINDKFFERAAPGSLTLSQFLRYYFDTKNWKAKNRNPFAKVFRYNPSNYTSR